ncbi:hypothetical protein CEXT_416341 [Caerostris extrusa]|uniref:Uncharacterized protein n=1 Tax=Caerostris extrusa TaxID=172846 RepID=A0AAV4XJ40_CAEEX|nr:hypothetical protein CEXT_416341 [Caerostris extrusa]
MLLSRAIFSSLKIEKGTQTKTEFTLPHSITHLTATLTVTLTHPRFEPLERATRRYNSFYQNKKKKSLLPSSSLSGVTKPQEKPYSRTEKWKKKVLKQRNRMGLVNTVNCFRIEGPRYKNRQAKVNKNSILSLWIDTINLSWENSSGELMEFSLVWDSRRIQKAELYAGGRQHKYRARVRNKPIATNGPAEFRNTINTPLGSYLTTTPLLEVSVICSSNYI